MKINFNELPKNVQDYIEVVDKINNWSEEKKFLEFTLEELESEEKRLLNTKEVREFVEKLRQDEAKQRQK